MDKTNDFLTDAFAQNVSPIKRVLTRQPGTAYLLGGRAALRETLDRVRAADIAFRESDGEFFTFGGDARKAAENFSWIHLHQYRHQARPSMPALAAHCLARLKISPDSPRYDAAMLIALRAERKENLGPEYHNIYHYEDVTAIGCELMIENNRLAELGDPGACALSEDERAETLCALLGHDLDHPGGKNALPGESKASDIYRYEDMHFGIMQPLLRAAGLGQQAIDEIHLIVRTTSPDGPIGILKAVAKAQRAGQPVDWKKIDPDDKYPELAPLAYKRSLLTRAAIVEDADLAASTLMGRRANRDMSRSLTAEWQKRGYHVLTGPKAGEPEDVRGPDARAGFAKFVFGGAPSSTAARSLIANYEEMMRETAQELGAQPAAALPVPVV